MIVRLTGLFQKATRGLALATPLCRRVFDLRLTFTPRFSEVATLFKFAVVTLMFFATAAAASPRDTSLNAIREVLRGPVEVELQNGVQYSGRIDNFDGETLEIAVATATRGEAVFTFEVDQIRRVRFPGQVYRETLVRWMEDPARTRDALDLFRAYYEQQAPFFDLLAESDFALFIEYARFALRNNEPIVAVAVAEEVRPRLQSAAMRRRLDDTLVLGFLRVGLADEAIAAARSWIRDADPAGDSALGWRVLAEIYMQAEDYEDALWVALQPIAYSGALPMQHLANCYAMAIVAAKQMRHTDMARRLYREMLERDLAWPDSPDWIVDEEPLHFQEVPVELSDEDQDSDVTTDDEEPPIQTPSPIDPLESLPTRIVF